MKQAQRIVKNAIFGIGGSAIGGLIYLATVLKIARSVSVTEFGKYSFVLAFAMFVSNVADSGLPRLLTRAVARSRGASSARASTRSSRVSGRVPDMSIAASPPDVAAFALISMTYRGWMSGNGVSPALNFSGHV